MTPMTLNEVWWHLFTLTGSIEAYLLYRGLLEPVESLPAADGSKVAGAPARAGDRMHGQGLKLGQEGNSFPEV
ncbi:hypothetical protein [Moorella sulfitireducens (nom. illeg.)]|uniref:hypothetical protein n=1 Tax=Neomoorella sulfitireducens TaxID=2972948 RepID=UPI0021AC69AD|nr:hypothetical protein [Moorella sulfitireducens]